MYPFYESKENSYFFVSTFNNFTFPYHFHNEVELILVLEGEIIISVNDNEKNLKSGELAVSFPNQIHSYKTTTSSHGIMVIFSPEILGDYFKNKMSYTLSNPYFNLMTIEQDVKNIIANLLAQYKENNNELIIKGMLYQLIGSLDNHFEFKSSKYIYNNTLQNILSYIQENYSTHIVLEDVSEYLGISRVYISKLFKNQKRMEMAYVRSY